MPVHPLVAAVFPWLAFRRLGRPVEVLLAFFLQLSLAGWIVAAVWAVSAVNRFRSERMMQEMIDAIAQIQKPARK